tara:strand:- start:938 stop:1303 length:366 start_codon:yes stop_codon:yes gene_type:complete
MSDYNDENIFSKILKKELPCREVFSDKNNISFEDINPQAPIHSLIIPRNKFKDFNDFIKDGTDEELASFLKSIFNVVKKKKVQESGYRIIINCGDDGNQEVPHLHAHLLAGRNLGNILTKH